MKEFIIIFDHKQVKTDEPILYITQARKLLRNARKSSGRHFNKHKDYILEFYPKNLRCPFKCPKKTK